MKAGLKVRGGARRRRIRNERRGYVKEKTMFYCTRDDGRTRWRAVIGVMVLHGALCTDVRMCSATVPVHDDT